MNQGFPNRKDLEDPFCFAKIGIGTKGGGYSRYEVYIFKKRMIGYNNLTY